MEGLENFVMKECKISGLKILEIRITLLGNNGKVKANNAM